MVDILRAKKIEIETDTSMFATEIDQNLLVQIAATLVGGTVI